MSRVRLSTTVDDELLRRARTLDDGGTDAAMVDAALRSLLERHRAAEIDDAYGAYEDHPLDEADEWGDLASFHDAAASS